ncbi:MAG: zinc-binding dehydrogenase [Pseudomonadota bacterium]
MVPKTALQMHSTVHEDGFVSLELLEVDIPSPKSNEVVIEMRAAPINPSDLGTMLAFADPSAMESATGAHGPVAKAPLSEAALKAAAARVGEAIALGNEGSGVVVASGSDDLAKSLMGRTVAIRGGCYAQYRCVPARECLVLPEGTEPKDAASCFVNPLTALGMVETMRLEGHAGLVHTAAASNLGQMLQRICTADDVPLVNIVRRGPQCEVLRGIGAQHVCDTSGDDFDDALTDALAATGATLGFDATGGGRLASQILAAMERALSRGSGFSRYGSTTWKQVYLYGNLQLGPTELSRTYGMAWGIGGWLLPNFLTRIGPEASQRLRDRVAAEITTTFASHYTKVISLPEALDPQHIAHYQRKSTGEKFLIALDG